MLCAGTRLVPFGILLTFGSSAFQMPEAKHLEESGLPGVISDATVSDVGSLRPLPAKFSSPNIDLGKMARWSLHYLNRSPRPALNYEPVFFVRPMNVPPAPEGHDPIVPGDTDARMDWEYWDMREIIGEARIGEVEQQLHARVLAYLHQDGFAWVPPGHYLEGEVYKGAKVGSSEVVTTWATAKILRSLSEEYKQHPNELTKRLARQSFVAFAQSRVMG